jgi:polyphenol oxidase
MIPSPSFLEFCLQPDWALPGLTAHVHALMTTRQGGVSAAPFDALNLRSPRAGEANNDDPQAVACNHERLASALSAKPVWLNQVHGARVVRIGPQDALPHAPTHEADASVTNQPGVACAVQVADCLPVLFAAPQGRAVGAAHAGWRGLAAGVLEATVAEVCAAANCEPAQVQAWLGACIGPQHFEVGADVLKAFGVDPDPLGAESGFVPAAAPGKWRADLCHLARSRLQACGVQAISGGHWCTFSAPERFFSFRRENVTGRMAAVIQMQ